MIFTKNKGGVRAIRGAKYKKKIYGGKIYSRTGTFGAIACVASVSNRVIARN